MIDTIVLTLTKDSFTIINPDLFMPSARWAIESRTFKRGMQSKQNPTKKELKNGIYKPRLTLSQRMNGKQVPELMLKVELSLPKLLFGNNFNELQLKDFKLLVAKLVEILDQMGIKTTEDQLVEASVSAVHYSKNIVFEDGSTPYHYINKLKEARATLSLDVNQTDYRNDGHSYRWHCNSYEIVFYDKIRDLEKTRISDKRTIEHDSALQLNLFESLQKRNKFEVLRMEVRLNKRQKLKQLFKKLNIKADLTFKKLFKPAISKKVLLHYFDEIISKRPLILDYKAKNDKALLVDLIMNNSNAGPKPIIQFFGLRKALELVSSRELSTMFSDRYKRSWQRFMKDIEKVQLPYKENGFAALREQLNIYKAFRFKA
jgi:hypothetical protein